MDEARRGGPTEDYSASPREEEDLNRVARSATSKRSIERTEEGTHYEADAGSPPAHREYAEEGATTSANEEEARRKDENEDRLRVEAEKKRLPKVEETVELLRACEARDKEAVFALTRHVRADGQDPLDARTPLHAAVIAGSEDLVILLLSSCPEMDVNKQDRGGATPLHEAVQFASEDIVDILVSDPRTNVNVGDKMDTTPLILAAHKGRSSIVEKLIHHGANVNAYTVIGTTALHSAAEQGHVGIVSLLLAKGAEANRQDAAGFTPLALAVQADNLEIVALLVRSGASITLQDQFGRTPMDLAVSEEVRDMLRGSLDYERVKQLASFAKKSVTLVTSDSDPLRVDFLPVEPASFCHGAKRARLGLCCCPGRNKKRHRRDIFKDLKVLTELDTDVLVTLVREVELQRMGATQLLNRSQEAGIESVWAPITDKWIPESMGVLISLVELLLARLREDKVIVVHCNGGKGRSGMVVVSVLVALGMKPSDAIDLVRAARPGTIRNPAQIFYVKVFAQTWQHRHAQQSPRSTPLRFNPPKLPPKADGGAEGHVKEERSPKQSPREEEKEQEKEAQVEVEEDEEEDEEDEEEEQMDEIHISDSDYEDEEGEEDVRPCKEEKKAETDKKTQEKKKNNGKGKKGGLVSRLTVSLRSSRSARPS